MGDPRWWVRTMSLTEAVSYLVLLGVAMPLKYMADMPLAVTVVGMAHGVLFLLLLWFLMRARFEKGWPWGRVALVGVAALVPWWPFFLDRRLRAWMREPA